jgi:hypothetical protein
MAAREKLPGLFDERKKLQQNAREQVEALVAWTGTCQDTVRVFEPELLRRLCALGCVLYHLFLVERDLRLRASLQGPLALSARTIHTLFGAVTFCRSYLRAPEGGGSCPVDAAVGLHPDKVSPYLAGLGTRLATKVSFETAVDVLGWILPKTLPKSTLQKAALGLGAFAQQFLDNLAPPKGDGEVAVCMIDGKCIPTATEREMRKRRGKRKGKPRAPSPRHRRRIDRMEAESRPRRKPGDKAKNGKQVVVVVVYTLKRKGDLLLGPLNKREFCVVGPKELGFLWLQGELARRGFGPKARGKTVHFVSDGDTDLQELADKYLPHARRTLDLYHGLEYVADAGHVLFPNDNDSFQKWYGKAKGQVLLGKVGELIEELRRARALVAKTGPGTKSKRETLDKVIGYLDRRQAMMNYAELGEQDMDISSGAVEGAVRFLVALRFDHGGMRWLRERANALLQLRCIEENGMWDEFLAWVFDGPSAKLPAAQRITRSTPAPLPSVPAPSSEAKKAA